MPQPPAPGVRPARSRPRPRQAARPQAAPARSRSRHPGWPGLAAIAWGVGLAVAGASATEQSPGEPGPGQGAAFADAKGTPPKAGGAGAGCLPAGPTTVLTRPAPWSRGAADGSPPGIAPGGTCLVLAAGLSPREITPAATPNPRQAGTITATPMPLVAGAGGRLCFTVAVSGYASLWRLEGAGAAHRLWPAPDTGAPANPAHANRPICLGKTDGTPLPHVSRPGRLTLRLILAETPQAHPRAATFASRADLDRSLAAARAGGVVAVTQASLPVVAPVSPPDRPTDHQAPSSAVPGRL